jgi:drug/metabolite transporter (DMT)-like permease
MEKSTLKKEFLGVFMTLLASFFYAFYGLLSKVERGAGISFFQLTFCTFFVSWIVVLPFVLKKGFQELKTKHFGTHLLRGVFGWGFILCFVLALKYISLVDGIMLNNTAPLFVPFIAYFWLKEPLNHKIWIAVLLGIVGVGFILKPGAEMFNPGMVLGLLAGILMAFAWASIRKLSRTEPLGRILFYFLTIATIIAAIPLPWVWQSLPLQVWGSLFFTGFSYLVSLAAFTYACMLIHVTVASILFFMVIVFTAFFQWAIWGQLPDIYTAIGSALIILGGALSIFLQRKR